MLTLMLNVNIASEVPTAKWLLKFGYPSVVFHNRYRIGSRISVNNANLSGNVQRVGPTKDTISGIGIGIGYWYR